MWVRCDECQIEEFIDTDARAGSPQGMEIADRWWDSHELEAHR